MSLKILSFYSFLILATSVQPYKIDTKQGADKKILVETPDNFPEEDPMIMGRIVGGYRGNIAELNYQASVQIKSNNQFKHFCDGSIVSATRIVSAAHCFYDGRFMEYAVRVGSNYSSYGGQFIGVRTIDIHPQFDAYTVDYDVAVLKLNSPISFNVNAQPILLPPSWDPVTPDSYAVISGWGVTKSGGSLSTALLKTSVPIVSASQCQKAYQGITQNMFCAGFMEEGGRDSCQGDSGGPLQISKDGKRYLIGIISWGFGCAQPRNPGVYAKVSSLRYWIDSKL